VRRALGLLSLELKPAYYGLCAIMAAMDTVTELRLAIAMAQQVGCVVGLVLEAVA
jgi:hypothetical protein